MSDRSRWRWYTFWVDPQARWLGDSFDLSYSTHLSTLERRGIIRLPNDMDEWLAPLTYAEQWTGAGWVQADSARSRLNPYPVFERCDPRWDKAKLPVRWQDL